MSRSRRGCLGFAWCHRDDNQHHGDRSLKVRTSADATTRRRWQCAGLVSPLVLGVFILRLVRRPSELAYGLLATSLDVAVMISPACIASAELANRSRSARLALRSADAAVVFAYGTCGRGRAPISGRRGARRAMKTGPPGGASRGTGRGIGPMQGPRRGSGPAGSRGTPHTRNSRIARDFGEEALRLGHAGFGVTPRRRPGDGRQLVCIASWRWVEGQRCAA
jgi:hypothetical protein